MRILTCIIIQILIIQNQVAYTQTISVFPHLETVSSFTTPFNQAITAGTGNGWSSSSPQMLKWELETADGSDLNTSDTGPDYDHTTEGFIGGNYIFLEASGGYQGYTSYLESPILNFGNSLGAQLNFWYHMYGSSTGSLHVEQLVNGLWDSTGWSKTGQQHSSGAAAWNEAIVNINPIATKIRFVGIRANSYYGDIAIDDIFLRTLSTNDAGITSIDNLSVSFAPGANNIMVTLKNFGIDTLTSATIKYSVNGGTVNSYAWTGSLLLDSSMSNINLGSHTFVIGSTDIKVWSESPNGLTDGYLSNDTLNSTYYVFSSLSGSYTVGGASSDFSTIGDAINAIQTLSISGDVVLNIIPGVYNKQINLSLISSLSSTKTVTFQSSTANPDDVIIMHNAIGYYDNYVVKLDGGCYFKFKNLTLKSLNPTYGRVVEVASYANYNEFSGNKLIGIATTSLSYNLAVIYSPNSNDHYNSIINNEIINGSTGIYYLGTGYIYLNNGTSITNNSISGFAGYGIYVNFSNAINISSNTISSYSTVNNLYGIYMLYCDNAISVRKNKISLGGTTQIQGMSIRNCDGTSTNQGSIVNNFISVGQGNSNIYGIYSYNSFYQNYYYNSINRTAGGLSSHTFYHTGGNTNIVNNIFSNDGGYGDVMNIPSQASVTTCDYNNLYSSNPGFVYWSGYYANLSALQTGSGKNLHSKSVVPGFMSTTDLHVNNDSLNGMGVAITGHTDDIDGETRSTTAPDIGADEFMIIAIDAGISQYVSPITPCSGIAYNVVVKLKNYGTTNLTSATINWKINGISKAAYNWTGILAPLTDTSIVLGPQVFQSNITNSVKVWSTLPNLAADLNLNNDTAYATILTSMNSGSYTIGSSSSADYSSFAIAISDLSNRGICGAVVFNVESGTYNEQFTLNEIGGMSSINTVTFQSLSGNKNDVILSYAAISGWNNYVINLNGGDYFKF